MGKKKVYGELTPENWIWGVRGAGALNEFYSEGDPEFIVSKEFPRLLPGLGFRAVHSHTHNPSVLCHHSPFQPVLPGQGRELSLIHGSQSVGWGPGEERHRWAEQMLLQKAGPGVSRRGADPKRERLGRCHRVGIVLQPHLRMHFQEKHPEAARAPQGWGHTSVLPL